MKRRLEKTWKRLSDALGTRVPKTMFVRILLEKGLVTFETSLAALDPNPRVAALHAQLLMLTPEEQEEFERYVQKNYPESLRRSKAAPESRSRKRRTRKAVA